MNNTWQGTKWELLIINLTILECKYNKKEVRTMEGEDNKSNHIGM